MNEVTDSSSLCLKASSSLQDTSTTILKEYCLRNSYAKSTHVLCLKGSNEANQHWATPLRDRGNNMIICTSSNICLHITALYNCKWIRGHPILMYLSMSGMQNSTGKAATSKSSYLSQPMTPLETCKDLNWGWWWRWNYIVLLYSRPRWRWWRWRCSRVKRGAPRNRQWLGLVPIYPLA